MNTTDETFAVTTEDKVPAIVVVLTYIAVMNRCFYLKLGYTAEGNTSDNILKKTVLNTLL